MSVLCNEEWERVEGTTADTNAGAPFPPLLDWHPEGSGRWAIWRPVGRSRGHRRIKVLFD